MQDKGAYTPPVKLRSVKWLCVSGGALCTDFCFAHIICRKCATLHVFKESPPKRRRYEFWQVNWDYFFQAEEEAKKGFKLAWKPAKHGHDDVGDLKRFLNSIGGSKASYSLFDIFNNSAAHDMFLTSRLQQCMVKFHYSDKLDSHRRLLNEYMTQRNKDEVKVKPELFGNTSLEEYKANMTARNYRFILSPETQLSEEDLRSYTKLFVDRLEQCLGTKVYWQAAVHTDTEHNHVHLLVNGKDMDGRMIRKIPPNFIKNVGRECSQEILTTLCGERTQEQIDAARDKRVYADRYTEYDAEIAGIQPIEHGVYSHIVRQSDVSLVMQKRLEHLKDLDLAEYRDGFFLLRNKWQDRLRAVGRYNTYFDAKKYVRDVDADLELYTADKGEIRGRIRHVYRMDDEHIWNHAFVIENEATKEAYYVPVYAEPDYAWREGMAVAISALPNNRGKLTVSVKKLSDEDLARETRKAPAVSADYESQFEF